MVNGTKQFLQKKRVAAKTNKTITWITSFVVSFGIMGLLSFFLIRGIDSGVYAKLEHENVETYEHLGYTVKVYHDVLPIEIDDLTENDYERYSTRWEVQESPLLAKYVAQQTPHFDDLHTQPSLEYKIIKVKVPMLYDWCFAELHQEYEEHPGYENLPEADRLHYEAINAEEWNANAAYRVYQYGEARNRYLICWDEYMVELRPDWELTAEQMQIISEKIQQL